ncbi:MAG: ATP-dependent helicase [Acidimicrobiia bacterium]|nr:ATP-dependent helicase [Acidimicrobiia bacterium]
MTTDLHVDPDDWAVAIEDHDGPQLVVGGPGTGKTEFLVRRALSLIDTADVPPEALLVLGFSRRGVAELRDRIEQRLGRSFTELPASTFHSLATRILEFHGPNVLGRPLDTLLTGPEQVSFVGALLAEENPSSWPHPYRELLPTRSFAKEVTDFILRCREQLIDPQALGDLASDRADWRALPEFLATYEEGLRAAGRVDYGTLLTDAISVIGDPTVASQIGESCRYLLVDEYQDTTTAQSEMLRRLAAAHGNLTVAADPYQSIYSFRGAEVDNVARFPDEFPDADGDPAKRFVLTTSFRVPSEILDAAVRVTHGGALPGSAGAVVAAPGSGVVETFGFQQQTEEAEWIASEIQRLHVEQQVPYRRMAVFVRSKRRFLPELSRSLERRGIPHDPPDARLADQPAVRMVLDCVIAATEQGQEQLRAFRRILLGPLFALPLGELREIERRRLVEGATWPNVVRAHVDEGDALADLIEDPTWAVDQPAAQGFWTLWTTLPQFSHLVVDPARANERSAWSSLAQVLGRLGERDPSETLAGYLELIETDDFEARPLLGYVTPDQDRLTVTSLHQAKGLEFDIVFIADAVEGNFPDLRPRESLLGSRHLSPSQSGEDAAYRRFRLQEEMRLAYTAMTRARLRVVWTATSSGFDGGDGAPSRFLGLVAGTATVAEAAQRPEPWGDPVTTMEAEAWLRRIVRDSAEPEPLRLAALHSLARGEQWGLRAPRDIAGTLERGPDNQLIDENHRLSPSQAEAYDRCPRRYALERRLGIGDEQTVYLEFGNLIHAVLEDAERAALDAGEARSTVDMAIAALSDRFDPVPFGGKPWSDAWRARGERALAHLYTYWPGDGVAVALERKLAAEIAGVQWVGKADRIDRTSNGLKIVDYKTSSRMPTVAEAAQSLQLGYYFFALAEDEEMAQFGEPVEAELWFVTQTKRKSLATRSFKPDQRDEVLERLADAARGILAEEWPATPNDGCDRCRVRLVCPAWPEGREAYG